MMKILRSIAAAFILIGGCTQDEPRLLRVCADPNNLPFSNRAGEGFENKLTELIASELDAEIRYTWWAQRRGNVRQTLNEGLCDVIPGVASEMEMLAPTLPYYASTYVAVTPSRLGLAIKSFDDPQLRTLKIGVQMIGDDFSNTPPAHALTRRGIIDNVRGYMVYGDYSRPDPQQEIITAVASGEIDVAFVWGPVAGYFASRQKVPLTLTPIAQSPADAQIPMRYGVAMGTRRRDDQLRQELDAALARRKAEIRRILAGYHVPITG